MEKSIVSFDGTQIYYRISRKSDFFLVFLHGLGGSINAWFQEEKILSDTGRSSLAIDLRGHGRSDRPNQFSAYRMENFARDIEMILKKEKIKKKIKKRETILRKIKKSKLILKKPTLKSKLTAIPKTS